MYHCIVGDTGAQYLVTSNQACKSESRLRPICYSTVIQQKKANYPIQTIAYCFCYQT